MDHTFNEVRRQTEATQGKNTANAMLQQTALPVLFTFVSKQRLEDRPFLMSTDGKTSVVSFTSPSVGYFRHRGLFDQTPTSLRSFFLFFFTSLTSNVWHSMLAADQLSAPRRGPTGPSQMPRHVGPDHVNRGQAGAPREPPHPHILHPITACK